MSSIPPESKGKLDTAEAINDAFMTLNMGQAILNAVVSMPPPPAKRRAQDFGPVLDVVRDKLLPLIDQVAEDLAD